MKTPEEIARLKKNWENDPCWDIEDTEGYEDHAVALRSWRMMKEAEWARKAHTELQVWKRKHDCPTDGLAKYLQRLEERIEKLENK